ncbi:Planctomycete cytochrome C [Planctomycetes bacterium Pan216]|uniref:Planctomycete cytochrome C n=1 Tax=Kolteria novifilia TaxID=2527975 RepID=A0A518AZU3_9BACT|nr:Planctomycete cytochrome C [Planctomycetes bacterium Pan216]
MVGALRKGAMGLAVLASISGLSTFAMADSAPSSDFFEIHIRPLLVERCLSCHDGSDEAESVLSLASREALIEGGDFGPALVVGKSAESLLWHAVNGTHKELRMPPDGDEPLTREEVAAVAKWIDDGAVWPKESTIASTSKVEGSKPREEVEHVDLWSFRPRRSVRIPTVDDGGWATTDIDRFVWRKLQEKGLRPVPTADRRTLIRRLYFDLTGLPPTSKEMREALADPTPEGLVAVVDRLLASPRYGERWGRHWLDVARYADTQGDVGDFPIPQAYLYRNWVIDALNADMPADRFLRLQLAGDILARESDDPKERREMTIATGFLALSRRFGNRKRDDMHLVVEDTIDTIGRGIMGITLRCARCHDHKFDPMTMDDYYGIYGILASTRYPWMGASDEKSPSELVPASADPNAQRRADEYWELIARYEYQINNHRRPWLRPTIDEYKRLKRLLEKAKEEGTPTTPIEVELSSLLDEHDRFRELLIHGLPWVRREKDRLAANPPYEMLFAVSEGDAGDARLHRRGNPERLGDVVPRGFVGALGGATPSAIGQGSGRLELARWITAPEHPLTARVLVNRVWQHHFGRGIVESASNFGVQGRPPAQPELLDYLTETFIEDGWSLKKLHRRIVLSRVYQLGSDNIDANMEIDPDNVYLWKATRRRLESEVIRDAMLYVSGTLDLRPGGRHPFPHWTKKRYSLNGPFKQVYTSNHRSVYLMTQRLFKHPVLDLFDGPDRNSSTESRRSTNVATQALFLMNSTFIEEQSRAFADRILRSGETDDERIESAYELAYARSAEPSEQAAAREFLATHRDTSASLGTKTNDVTRQAFVSFAKVLLTSNEFFFVD